MINGTKCVYAGSFDPLTEGHMYMIKKGAELFERLVVALGANPNKRCAFSTEERLELLRECTSQLPNVEVDWFENLFLVQYAASTGAQYILRGVRSEEDYVYERTMRNINEDLNPGVTTVFLMPPRQISEVSSSFVKGLIGPQGWEDVIRPYVPEPVYRKLLAANVKWHKQSGGAETSSD